MAGFTSSNSMQQWNETGVFAWHGVRVFWKAGGVGDWGRALHGFGDAFFETKRNTSTPCHTDD